MLSSQAGYCCQAVVGRALVAVVKALPAGQSEYARVLSSMVDGLCDPSGKRLCSAGLMLSRGRVLSYSYENPVVPGTNEICRWERRRDFSGYFWCCWLVIKSGSMAGVYLLSPRGAKSKKCHGAKQQCCLEQEDTRFLRFGSRHDTLILCRLSPPIGSTRTAFLLHFHCSYSNFHDNRVL